MATYAVDTRQLRVCAEQMQGLQRELDSVALRLTGFQLGSTLQMRGSVVLMARVGDCKWAAISQSDDLGRMSQGLGEVIEFFEECERKLTEPQTQAQAQAREAAEREKEFWETLMEYFPLMEFIGFGVEVLGRVVWDLTDVFSDAVGWVMSGIESVLDNFEEFSGDLTDGQFWFELLGDTAVDGLVGLGVGAGLTALVGGVGALATTLGVPVIVAALGISAAAAAICWVGDSICRLITDDDLSELVVDSLWKFGEWAGGRVETIGEYMLDAGELVMEGAEALWNSAGEFIDTLLPW